MEPLLQVTHDLIYATNEKSKHLILAGHSFGGNVAAAYALQYPTEVSAVVLLDPGSYLQFHTPRAEKIYQFTTRATMVAYYCAMLGIVRIFAWYKPEILFYNTIPKPLHSLHTAYVSQPSNWKIDELVSLRVSVDWIRNESLTHKITIPTHLVITSHVTDLYPEFDHIFRDLWDDESVLKQFSTHTDITFLDKTEDHFFPMKNPTLATNLIADSIKQANLTMTS